jgi:hypothetical protein
MPLLHLRSFFKSTDFLSFSHIPETKKIPTLVILFPTLVILFPRVGRNITRAKKNFGTDHVFITSLRTKQRTS